MCEENLDESSKEKLKASDSEKMSVVNVYGENLDESLQKQN